VTDARSATDPAALELDADSAAASGDLGGARRLLEQVTREDPDRIEPWLKLTAMCRATGDVKAALGAIAGALCVEPLGFLPLLLQASLLDQAGRREEAGEVYGYALAQMPDEVPPHLRPMVEQARRRQAEHVEGKAQRLAAASAAAEAGLGEAERRRIARFRSNIVRTTRPYHSEPTHFHYPGLREREFHDRDAFPWLADLEAATEAVTEDFHRVVNAERAELVPYVDYPDHVAMRQWKALNRNRAWTAIHLLRNGEPVAANARHCSATLKLLERVDQPQIRQRGPNAMFSLLAPGAHIPPHVGVSNTRLVCHLPLIVPPGCWFRVGAETREWEAGKAFVFDDTIEHEALNPSAALRVILIVDAWHPDLSPAERTVVTAVMEASDPDPRQEGL
jgi:hypothetical protein